MNLRTSLLALGGLALLLIILRSLLGPGFFRGILYVGIAVGLLSTVVALFTGLGMMTFGAATQDKQTQARWTTYLMRSRVFAQGMTILCGTLLLWSREAGLEDA